MSRIHIDIGEEVASHLEQHEGDLNVLAEIAALVAKRSEPEQLITSVLAVLERRLGMLRGTVMLLLHDGQELLVEAAHGLPQTTVRKARYRPGEGVVGPVIATEQPIVVPRVSAEPRFQNRIHNRPLKDCDEVSFLCVPIRAEGELIGTLSVDLPEQPPDWLAERLRVLEIVATMISYDVRWRQADAMRQQTLEAENLRLRDALQEQLRPENIIGNSHAMRAVYHLPPTLQMPAAAASERGQLKARVELVERDLITDALKSCGGSVTMAAKHLGITPRMVRYKLKNLGIDLRQFKVGHS